ncbi:MAG: sulfite exporter TauE/SafE family protein [Chloroflexi bacterium]|nr:sulfite exporter TauE/SafE family protein [Chloroflexota bacterium]
MNPVLEILLAGLIMLAALLYSAVGHGGGSGYLAAMALFDIPPEVMRPTALALNILVSGLATYNFSRAGHFSWRLFWPFALVSIPFSYLGGSIALPGGIYRPLVSLGLWFAALRLMRPSDDYSPTTTPPPLWVALLVGSGVGLLAGLTGIGGGIFLSPLMVLLGWADARRTSGVSAPFILVNSLSGLGAHLAAGGALPAAVPLWGLAALMGGLLGAHYGSRRLANQTLRRLLAAALVIAGLKMLLG